MAYYSKPWFLLIQYRYKITPIVKCNQEFYSEGIKAIIWLITKLSEQRLGPQRTTRKSLKNKEIKVNRQSENPHLGDSQSPSSRARIRATVSSSSFAARLRTSAVGIRYPISTNDSNMTTWMPSAGP